MSNLSDRKYWDDGYLRTDRGALPDLADFRNLPERRLIEALETLPLKGKNILELGAGDSTVLLMLSRRWGSDARFVGLDYSEAGCAALTRRAQATGADISVVQADMFSAPEALAHKFDIVYSNGLVEHFTQLDSVLRAKGRFLKPGGLMFTLIPNMSGLIGKLTKRYNPAVYEIHNPHDVRSFLEGHSRAGLEVVQSGYLCSTNFGVLSSCFDRSGGPGWNLYVFLSRISKAVWLLESKLAEFPKTASFSPYIYAVSRIKSELEGMSAGRGPS